MTGLTTILLPWQDLVHQFHVAYGVVVQDTPNLDVRQELIELRVNLLREEMGEFAEALQSNDLIEVADALGDYVYIALGSAISFGITIDPIFRSIHNDYAGYFGIDTDWRQSFNPEVSWTQLMISDAQVLQKAHRQPSLDVTPKMAKAMLDQLQAFTEVYVRYSRARNCERTSDALARAIYFALSIATTFGIDLDPVFREIQRSNMSKLDENGQPVMRADGKVLKSHLWSPPDLAPILAAQPPLF